MAAARTTACATIATSFRVPEFGMREFEPLTWASATLFPAKRGFPRAYHVLANGHVAMPWKYTGLYTAEQAAWLRHVEARHCRYELRVVDEAGGVVARAALGPVFPRPHGHRDLAALYLEDEAGVVGAVGLRAQGIDFVAPDLATQPLLDTDVLEITGHSVGPEDEADDLQSAALESSSSSSSSPRGVAEDAAALSDSPMRRLVPMLVEARLRLKTPHQTFLSCASTLPQGFCGAPALYPVRGDPLCAGLVDGIVAPAEAMAGGGPSPTSGGVSSVGGDAPISSNDELRRRVAGCASIIPADEIRAFLDDLEGDEQLRADLLRVGRASSGGDGASTATGRPGLSAA
mmetsp:Transcript_20969/g.83594  ORF Transcript_20969/g.83594 Transcript_20969/m.83594 type:complete len:346 (+) Transcript_20969:112-1149(+)